MGIKNNKNMETKEEKGTLPELDFSKIAIFLNEIGKTLNDYTKKMSEEDKQKTLDYFTDLKKAENKLNDKIKELKNIKY